MCFLLASCDVLFAVSAGVDGAAIIMSSTLQYSCPLTCATDGNSLALALLCNERAGLLASGKIGGSLVLLDAI